LSSGGFLCAADFYVRLSSLLCQSVMNSRLMTREKTPVKTILGEAIVSAPRPHDPDAAQRLRDAVDDGFNQLTQGERALIEGVAGCSPYLSRLMARDFALVVDILRAPPRDMLARACATAAKAGAADAQAEQIKTLRRAKDEAALAIALADIAGVWTVMEAAGAVSTFADAAVNAALTAAAKFAKLEHGARGIAVLAMGKHGGEELNYSSDIDLVLVFDHHAMGFATSSEAQAGAVKAAREMVNLLQTQTPDGYVFRTDLRLRPDPGVSALAISVTAAEAYYEAYGQNWERMAYIKARAAAGDIAVGTRFLQALRPFVWRKHLDFATIEDVHAVKRQIQSAKGGAKIEFEGHDIKLGRGGIREIEFYVQTQQLILGGKNPALRSRTTLEALAALAANGHIADAVRDELSAAYRYLRMVEHRLQMVNDEQTHRIPQDADAIDRLALFTGETNAAALRRKLLETLARVERRYDDLFRDKTSETLSVGPLVFTGVENDPATLATLEGLGFKRASEVCEAIRRWHAGGMRATRTERARLLLTKLMNPLMEALSKAGNPDDAFFAFSDFLSRLPSGVQVFSLLANNLALFDVLIRIMTISPFLGRQLSQRINIIEGFIETGLAQEPPPLADYAPALGQVLRAANGFEDALNLTRRWAGEHKFPIAAQLATGLCPPYEAAAHFSAIADACIIALTPAAQEEMRAAHGTIDGALAVVALGRLGSRQMTATSDIDLMFIYDAPADAVSDGRRPLQASEYFTRLVRRIITALSAATPEGALYDVDMQLRPSGRAGPAAVSLSAFRQYYEKDAWTWEQMALTRARTITGPAALAASIEAEIEHIVRRPRTRANVAEDVNDMRRRLLEAKPGKSPWDVKNILGGLTDIAFICQYLALATGEDFGRPPRATTDAVKWFAQRGELNDKDASALGDAQALFDAVLHGARAATGGIFIPDGAGEMLSAHMASLCGAASIDDAERNLIRRQSAVAQIYRSVMKLNPSP
jgi:[glutamine synthetase] adenylyltransferase / [glutamine synthetase]-adenylyl-L-tyrosine phosphorylase